MTRPTTWAIFGTGAVSRKFVLGLRALPSARVLAVASRDPDRARAFAADFGIPAHGSYADMAGAADVVYVATPPAQHEEHALLAIAAGKAVLIEKPFAMDSAAAGRIVAAARSAQVFAMEAMWTRHLPLLARLRALLAEGRLGQVTQFSGSFCQANRPDPRDPRFDVARGGGALMYRGIYAVSLARDLLGPIAEVSGALRRGTTGVDEDCALTLRHTSGALSQVRASLVSGGDNGFSLHGTAGHVSVAPPIYRPSRARLVLDEATDWAPAGKVRRESLRESGLAQALAQRLPTRPKGAPINAFFTGNGYQLQAEAVATSLARGEKEHDLMPLDQSLEIMGLLDRARALG